MEADWVIEDFGMALNVTDPINRESFGGGRGGSGSEMELNHSVGGSVEVRVAQTWEDPLKKSLKYIKMIVFVTMESGAGGPNCKE